MTEDQRAGLEDLDCAYEALCSVPSDIHEHLPTLRALASECETVTEFGVRTGVSTIALLAARPKRMTSYDIRLTQQAWQIELAARVAGLDYGLIEADVLTVNIEPTDLLFIDTLHVFRQLRAELDIHQGKARRFIVLHDTTTFGDVGEDGSTPGLWAAVEEFLAWFDEWRLRHRYTNNNGLTVLERKASR